MGAGSYQENCTSPVSSHLIKKRSFSLKHSKMALDPTRRIAHCTVSTVQSSDQEGILFPQAFQDGSNRRIAYCTVSSHLIKKGSFSLKHSKMALESTVRIEYYTYVQSPDQEGVLFPQAFQDGSGTNLKAAQVYCYLVTVSKYK